MSYNNLKLEINSSIATILFNRPKAYNALNSETLLELEQIIDALNDKEEIKIIIFTGSGKAFIAGADISEMANMNESQALAYCEIGVRVFRKIEVIDKVTIAAVNGFCLGGGNELAMACDIRIASEFAKFGQPEVSLGITPGFSGTQRLPRIIGVAKARELLFTGKVISSEEALKIGLVNNVVSSENLLNNVKELADSILKNANLAVIATKKAINDGLEKSMDEAILIEKNYFSKCFNSEDQKEGMKAFLEKRTPNYQSK